MRIFSSLIFLVGALSLTTLSGTAAATSAAEIESAADRYLTAFVRTQEAQGREVTYSLGSLDPRLKLAECHDALAFEFVSEPEKSVRNTLLASCTGDRPWRLFLNAEIEISADAYVAATPLSRGVRVSESVLRKEKVVVNQSRGGVYHSLDGLIGMEIRRPIREGTLLVPSVLATPEAVARGDQVKIEAKSGPIVIETQGIAVTAGKVGEQIAVENSRSGREIRGVIIAPGHVRVVM